MYLDMPLNKELWYVSSVLTYRYYASRIKEHQGQFYFLFVYVYVLYSKGF